MISRIWKNFLSDFKWPWHRLAHAFADGWSTASHTSERTLLEEPTWTLLIYYRDIKQEIVQILPLEEYVVSKKWLIIMDRIYVRLQLQQKKMDLRLTIVIMPEVYEEAQRKGMEAKKNRNKFRDCNSYVQCVDIRCFL